MAENKTQTTSLSVQHFIAAVPDAGRRADAETVAAMMARLSGEPATMWGPSIIGFGSCHYRYESGHGGEMCRIGFSPRKAELVLYVLANGDQSETLSVLGKHRAGKGCLYIKKLADIDMEVLEGIVRDKLAQMRAAYPD